MRGITANGPNIRRRRKKLGMTQEELSVAIGCDVRTLRNAEKSRPMDSETLQTMARMLNVDLFYICVSSSSSTELEQQRMGAVWDWARSLGRRDIEAMLTIYEQDALVSWPSGAELPGWGTASGITSIRQQFEQLLGGFVDQQFDEKDASVYASGNMVILRATWSADLAMSRGRFESESLHEFEFVTDKVLAHTGLFDTATIANALVAATPNDKENKTESD